jgi:hypothetical protein
MLTVLIEEFVSAIMFKKGLPKREKERVKVFLFKKKTKVLTLIDRNNQDSMTGALMEAGDIPRGL